TADAPLIISTILPPRGVQFNFGEDFRFGPPAISPDGQQMTYSAMRDGRIRLFLRPLNSDQTREPAGTDDGLYPFWSPDSRFIAFFAGGKLKKLSLSDDNVTDIATGINNGRGGS